MCRTSRQDRGRSRRRLLGRALAGALVVAASLAAAPAAQAATFDPHLTRAPYLTDLVAQHVTVNWATDRSATTGSLRWGPVSGGVCTLSNTQPATRISITVGAVAEYQWKASPPLPALGTWCYRPLLTTTDLLAAAPSPQFSTQVAAGDTTPFSFAVFGDWGQVDATGKSADQANLFAKVAASGARFAVTVGDNGYPSGSQTNYGDLQQVGKDTSAIFGPSFWTVAGSSIPLFTAAGNHGLSGTSHTDITTWTQDAAVASSGGRYQNDVYCCVNGTTSQNYGSEWYAFDAGPARFYLLDSAWGDTNTGTANVYANDAAAHFTPGTPEYTWLANDLAAHPGTMKFAFSHYPFYSDQADQNSDTYLTGPTRLEGLLAANGVKVVFNGHAHIYERNLPSAPGMPVTYVTGGGGATLQPVTPCSAIDAYARGWSPTKLKGYGCGGAAASPPTSASQVFHFLKVTLAGSTVTVTPTDENGATFDAQTYSFGGADTTAPSVPTNLTGTAPSSSTVNLGWTASTDDVGVTGYDVLRDGTKIATVAAPATAYTDATVTGGTTYSYTVAARDAAGNVSAASAPVVVTTVNGASVPSLVQAAGSAAQTVTLPVASGSGHLLVLSASLYTGSTNNITSVTDQAGNVWTRIGAYSSSGHNSDGELWYAANAAPTSTVTVHTATVVNTALELQEYAGVAPSSPLDTSIGTAATGTAAASGAITPAAANELLVGFTAGHGNAQAITLTAPGFTGQAQQTTAASVASIISGYRVLSAPSAQSFTASFGTAMYWAGGVAAFKPAP